MTGALGTASPLAPKTAETFDRAYTTRMMILLAGMVMIVMYIEGMLTPSLMAIQADFGVSYAQVSLVLSAYLVTGVALSPIAGKLGDIYGKKRVLTVVLSIYTVAVAVTGFSPTFTFMVVSRAVQGVGLTVFPVAMALVREEFPRDRIPRAQATLSALFGAGFAVSLPLGAWVSNAYGWQFTYHTAIPFVAAITIATFVFVRESPFRRPGTSVDYVGAGLLAASLALFVLALAQGPTWGWTSGAVLGMLVAGGLILLPLSYYELRRFRRQADVILDFRLLKTRNILVTNLIVVVSGFGMFLAFQSLTFLLLARSPSPVGFGLDIFQVGLAFVPFAGAMLVMAPLVGRYVSRVGTKPLTIIGCLVGALGFIFATQVTTLASMLAAMFVMGAGLAIVNASVINLLVLTADPRDMGIATSMNAAFRNVGSSLGAPLAGSLLTTFTVTVLPGVSVASATAYNAAFLIAAAALGIAAVITLFAHEVLGRRAVRQVVLLTADSPAPGPPLAETLRTSR
jgi:MFS family permease